MAVLSEAARRLKEAYPEASGGWWPVDDAYHGRYGSDARFEVMVGAILTQNTAWSNVERALARLKGLHLLAPTALAKAEAETVRQAIRPAGHYNQKAAYVQAMAKHVVAAYAGELDALLSKPTRALRTELLALRGVGPETADAILVYAAGRPRFIVDAYTRRLMRRLGAASGSEAYDEIQAMWNGVLGRRTADHAWVHGAIVEHAKRRCTLRRPTCTGCPLREVCMQRGVDAWA